MRARARARVSGSAPDKKDRDCDIPVATAYLVGADSRRVATSAPPMKKAAATTHQAMIRPAG